MSDSPLPIRPPGERPALEALAGQAARYAAQSSGPGTRRAYRSAWRAYATWCEAAGRVALAGDPQQLALYLTQRAEDGLAVSSLLVARAAIRAAHRLAGIRLDLDDPRLALVMEGIVRSKGARPRRQAAAAVPEVLRRLLAAVADPASPPAAAAALIARHRAMLLIGFGAALRRSELAGLLISDIGVVAGRGMTLLVRRSKTDQHGHGRSLAVWANLREPAFCPVAAFETWMAYRRTAADVAAGADPPLFCAVSPLGRILGGAPMADKIVNRLLKQAAARAGLDAARFSGHSLRRGLLTDAGDRQIPLADLMRHSRHASVETALGYIDHANLWRNNITEGVFRPPPPVSAEDG